MRILTFVILSLIAVETFAQDSITIYPYFTVKENISKNKFVLNPTVGLSFVYDNFDFKVFYGTNIIFCDYAEQFNASVGGVTLTYNFKNITKLFVPYATCRVNIYDAKTYGYNPAVGIAFNYKRYSLRLFDGINIRNQNRYMVFGASLTYSLKYIQHEN